MRHLLNKMKKLNENKNGKVITFDFDNTIVKSFENNTEGHQIQYQFGGLNDEIIKRIKKFKDAGVTVFVVTSRNVDMEIPESSVDTILSELNIKVDGVFYTNGNIKAEKLYELGSSLHYDDDPKEHEAIKEYANLHKNFNITVKYPDELLSDINEVAKGLIMTADKKFLAVQRSDSYEWDAPGGHLMQGEEAPYAFWRETKEELGLEVKNVSYLDSKDTIWEDKKKLVHYFIASVPYTCLELQGAVSLQWEIADYFCGTLDELGQLLSSAEGGTANLENSLILLGDKHETLFESSKFQQKMSKNHSTMKKRLVGTDGREKERRNTGASGLKRVKDHSRAKSAPPGAPGGGSAPSLEENAQQPKKKIKIKFLKDVEEKKKRKKRRKGKKPGPKKGSKRKKTANKYHWGVGSWDYGGGYGSSSDGGGDGGGGE